MFIDRNFQKAFFLGFFFIYTTDCKKGPNAEMLRSVFSHNETEYEN